MKQTGNGKGKTGPVFEMPKDLANRYYERALKLFKDGIVLNDVS